MFLLGSVLLALFLPSSAVFQCPPPETTLIDFMNQPSQQVQPGQNCSFTVTLPVNSTQNIISVDMTAKGMGPSDSVKIVGSYDTVSSDPSQTIFSLKVAMPQQITVTVISSANTAMTFGFTISNQPFPTSGKTVSLSTGVSEMAQFIQTRDMQVGDTYEITASNEVAFSAANYWNSPQFDFLNVFVYNGFGENKTLIGSLYSAQTAVFISLSRKATLIKVMASSDSLVGTIIANENQNLNPCSTYSFFFISPSVLTNGAYQTELDGTKGPACLTLLNDVNAGYAPYLANVIHQSDDGYALAKVGAPGGPSLGTYKRIVTNLPQFFPGFARTFIANNEKTTLTFVLNSSLVNDHLPYTGRHGFIMSPNFGFNSSAQSSNTSFFFKDQQTLFHLTFNVATSAINTYGAHLVVDGYNNYEWINLARPTGVHSYIDTRLNLQLVVGNSSNTGYLITYIVNEDPTIVCYPNATTSQGVMEIPSGVVPSNFNCSFEIHMQPNEFVDLFVGAQLMRTGEKVEVQYLSSGKINNAGNSKFSVEALFPAPKVTILVQSGPNTRMRFGYSFTRYTRYFNPQFSRKFSAKSTESAQFIPLNSPIASGSLWTIETDVDLSLISESYYSDLPLDYRNFFVIAGTDPNGPVVSTLYDLWQQSNVLFPKGAVIYYAGQDYYDGIRGMVVANAATNLKNCPNYSVQWTDQGPLTVNATQGPTCTTILMDTYFQDVNATMAGNAKVIVGAPSTNPILLSTLNPPQFTYPQDFPGIARTIILDRGLLTVQLGYHNNDDGISYNGRTGFIATNNYGFNATNQVGLFSAKSTSLFNFTFTVQQFDSQPGAQIQVSRSYPQKTIYFYNISNNPISIIDTSINLQVNNGNKSSTGSYITYEIFKAPENLINCPQTVLNNNYTNALRVIPDYFDCTYTFSYDQSYAEVTIKADNIGPDEIIEVRGYPNIKINNGANSSVSLHTVFVPKNLYITVKSGYRTKMTLTFSVGIIYFRPYDYKATNSTLGGTSTGQYIQLNNNLSAGTAWKIYSQSRLRLALGGPFSKPPLSFLNILYCPLGGNVYQCYPLYSLSNTGGTWTADVLIYVALSIDTPMTATVVGYIETKSCSSQSVQWAYGESGPVPNQIVMDARQGTACLTILNDYNAITNTGINAPYFKSMDLQGNSSSSVIVNVGAPIDDPYDKYTLATMANSSTFSLPQYFPGFARTITLNSGYLKLNLTFDPVDAGDSVATIGRKGFIASENYMFDSSNQDAYFSLKSNDNSFFTFILMFPLQNPSYATITVSGSTQKPMVVDLSNYWYTRNFTYVDSSIDVTIKGNQTGSNRGTMMRYTIDTGVGPTTTDVTTEKNKTTTPASAATVSVLLLAAVAHLFM